MQLRAGASYLVGGPLMLGHSLGVLAALGGRKLSHPDLPVTSAHGQGRVPAVWQELGLEGSQ